MPRLCLGKPLEDAPNRRVALGPGERTVEMGGIHLTLMIGAVGLVVTVAEHEIPPQGRLRDARWSRTAKALAPHRSCAADRVRWRRFRPAPPSLAARRQEHPPARSEEHTSELQSLMRISDAVFCL